MFPITTMGLCDLRIKEQLHGIAIEHKGTVTWNCYRTERNSYMELLQNIKEQLHGIATEHKGTVAWNYYRT